MKKRRFRETRIKDVVFESNGSVFRLDLERTDKDEDALPGQYILLEPLSGFSVMPRPFSVFWQNKDKYSLLIKIAGANTSAYARLYKGIATIHCIGPLGRPIPIDHKVDYYILVGGGIGVASLTLLAEELSRQKKDVKILLGVKTNKDLVGTEEFDMCGFIPEFIFETGEGKTGLVTYLLEKKLKVDLGKSVVIACGPNRMLKKVAELCYKRGNKCYVVLEEIMACGVGSCKGCAVFGKNLDTGEIEVKHVCSDGPTFDAEWIDWNKLIKQDAPAIITKRRKNSNPMKTVLKGREGRKLVLSNPSMNSSGCLGKEALELEYVDIKHAGALVTKGVSVSAKLGNPGPRVCEIGLSMLNSIGLENVGIENFIRDELPVWFSFNLPVIVNIAGTTIEEYFELARKLSNTKVAALEINISCPNVKEGGMAFGTSPENTFEVIKKVREAAPDKFLIAKLTPNVTDIVIIAKASIKAGADALSLINTVKSLFINIKTRRSKLGAIFGGMSGSHIKPLAIRMVYEVHKDFPEIPIIGMGGIANGEDAAEFIIAGASAVAVGTALFSNRNIFSNIHSDLLDVLKMHKVNHISDLVGSLVK
jgi:dihydroorotate dehydrogenase (NAD+) catalytic subunit